MKWFLHSLAMMFGAAPRKPEGEEIKPAAREMMKYKKLPDQVKKRKELIAHEHEFPVVSNKWRYRRWASILFLNALFIVSYWFDVQLVEGALTASRFEAERQALAIEGKFARVDNHCSESTRFE